MRPIRKKVKVADGSLVEIVSYLILEISFIHGNAVTSASVNFLVMKGLSMELVIGLPDICRLFKEVLFYMMNSPAMEEMESLQLINPEFIGRELSEAWSKPVLLQSSEED